MQDRETIFARIAPALAHIGLQTPTRSNPHETAPGEEKAAVEGKWSRAAVRVEINSATNQCFINLDDANSFVDSVDQGFTLGDRLAIPIRRHGSPASGPVAICDRMDAARG